MAYPENMKRRDFLGATIAAISCAAGWSGPLYAQDTQVRVFKDPSCGCCGEWIKHLAAAGFIVEALDRSDMTNVKTAYGVPGNLQSCHTAVIGRYVIEGHVPVADIERLLSEEPSSLGLAVPGMPIGSPGMEVGDEREPYDVILFGSDGTQSVYARY